MVLDSDMFGFLVVGSGVLVVDDGLVVGVGGEGVLVEKEFNLLFEVEAVSLLVDFVGVVLCLDDSL